MELVHGVNALRHLEPTYPWDDVLFLPTLFYKWGLIEHVTNDTSLTISDEDTTAPRIPDFENDPSAEDDEVVINF